MSFPTDPVAPKRPALERAEVAYRESCVVSAHAARRFHMAFLWECGADTIDALSDDDLGRYEAGVRAAVRVRREYGPLSSEPPGPKLAGDSVNLLTGERL